MTISLVNACLPVHENEGRDGDHGPVEDHRLGVRIPSIGYTVDNPVCCGTRWRSHGGGSSGVVQSHIRRWARHMGYLRDIRRELGSDRSWCQLAKHPVGVCCFAVGRYWVFRFNNCTRTVFPVAATDCYWWRRLLSKRRSQRGSPFQKKI